MRLIKTATVILLATLVIALSSACSGGSAASTATPTPAVAISGRVEVAKPKPVVLGISAATSGMFDSYYTVLDVTIRNDGADGMVILVGSIDQADQNTKSELPVYLAGNITETVRMVLPLKWRGGDWTPSVVTEIP